MVQKCVGRGPTWGTHLADRRGCEELRSGGPHMRSSEIQQKSSKINDPENEPRHVWRLPNVLGVTRDDMWHHEIS